MVVARFRSPDRGSDSIFDANPPRRANVQCPFGTRRSPSGLTLEMRRVLVGLRSTTSLNTPEHVPPLLVCCGSDMLIADVFGCGGVNGIFRHVGSVIADAFKA